MAYLIPENLRSRRDVPPGVTRVAAALRDGLDDDVVVWYEPMFDVGGQRPDLVVLIPSLGILVLEVFESRAFAMRGAEAGSLILAQGGEDQRFENPLRRAQRFAGSLQSSIESESRLSAGQRLPVAAGAVLPYISHEAAVGRHLGEALPVERCLFRDDVEAGTAGERHFRSRISRLVGASPRDPLPDNAERLYRALIHPDTVIGSRQLPFPTIPAELREDDLMVLDRRQEALAKTVGTGHRVVRGTAGSGKTLVLTYRARLLAENFPRQAVLVTCFTRALAGRLRHQLAPWRNISVNHLDALMAQARREAGLEVADFGNHSRAELAELALRSLDTRPEGVPRYHHVLIDEAQDFPTPALQFAVRLLVDGSDSLLAVADPVQNIFGTRFTWKAAGINAVGRTRWLQQSYRNTREILEYAHRFVIAGGGFEVSSDPDPDNETAISAPRFSERSGPLPVVLSAPSRQAEVVSMAAHSRSLLEKGMAPSDLAILYGVSTTGGFNWPLSIREVFHRQRLAVFWANDPSQPSARDRIGEDKSKILLCTIASAKGLEFRYVVLCGFLDDQPPEQSRVSRSLIYVGMTRATHGLALSASGHHPYLADLERG